MKTMAWTFMLLLVGSGINAGAQADRPNIVWLVSEDNSAEWLRLYDKHGSAAAGLKTGLRFRPFRVRFRAVGQGGYDLGPASLGLSAGMMCRPSRTI